VLQRSPTLDLDGGVHMNAVLAAVNCCSWKRSVADSWLLNTQFSYWWHYGWHAESV